MGCTRVAALITHNVRAVEIRSHALVACVVEENEATLSLSSQLRVVSTSEEVAPTVERNKSTVLIEFLILPLARCFGPT